MLEALGEEQPAPTTEKPAEGTQEQSAEEVLEAGADDEITSLSQVATQYGVSETDFLDVIKVPGAAEGDPAIPLSTVLAEWREPTNAERFPIVATRMRELATERTELTEAHSGALQMMQRNLSAMIAAVGDEDAVDWDALKRDMAPHEYLERKETFERRRQAFSNTLDHLKNEHARVEQETTAAEQTRLGNEARLLLEAMPAWTDQTKLTSARTQMQETAAAVGLSPDDLKTITDHRHIQVLWKASEYDRLLKLRRSKLPGLRKLPKVTLRAGARRSEGADNASRRAKVLSAHRKLGTEQSGAQAIRALFGEDILME